MNKTIERLSKELDNFNQDYSSQRTKIKDKLQVAYNKLFENDKALEKALTDFESATEYDADEHGIYRYFRYNGLDDIPEDAREYLQNYLDDMCITIDFENSCFMSYEGDSFIIQDDSRSKRDNGVWFNHNQVIEETEYTNEDNEVDESKRNALIEAYMEKTGYYPGVFRIDYHGNVSFVNTKA